VAAADRVNPPDPGPDELRGLRDFLEIYEAHFDEAMTYSMSMLAADAPAGQTPTAGPVEEEVKTQENRLLVRRAILDGEWEPYWNDMRAMGATFARMGLMFPAWVKIVNALHTVLSPHLLRAHRDDPDRLVAAMEAMTGLMDRAIALIGDEYLRTKEETIGQQRDALRELWTPVLQVRERMLLLPVIGVVDSQRAQQLTEDLLRAIRDNRARVAVVDITGVPVVDTRVANHLVQTVEAARLMGAELIVTGLSPEVAQALVALGVELGKVTTIGDLRGGLEEAERLAA
jgi:rsbT co-antagonist protein RsbR